MAYTIPPGTSIGHVHLKVSDLDRAEAFYRDALGFELQQRYGSSAAFLSAGGGGPPWQSHGGPPPPAGTTGLFHLAVLYPTRGDLARALKHLLQLGVPIDGASDHGVSEAIYLRDPDGNGIELYRDRPRDEWPVDGDGELLMVTDPLDVAGLLAEA